MVVAASVESPTVQPEQRSTGVGGAPDDDQVRAALKKAIESESHQMCKVDIAWNMARMGDRSEMETSEAP